MLRKRGVRVLLEIVLGSTITNDLLSSNLVPFYHNSCDLPDISCPQSIYLYFLKLLLTACCASKSAIIWEPLKKCLLLFSLCFHVFWNTFQFVFIILLKCFCKISTKKKWYNVLSSVAFLLINLKLSDQIWWNVMAFTILLFESFL